ncbi:acetoacetyl-CoA reductase [Trinickia caryophylli]|uniref:3-oxoacyl-[acyl-carrier-protein] reductase n=1 Tax=Trinickia caryophylli TaxID=28094 RepID=A0A1X7EBT0_TRICW|nr:acetoacetyl-CoA reductase [Trinickia caryophylli]PMS12935.1 acetoacetyl-CoA reductase [Trinickia caryophylli]TRX14696.1 acetoacetyl-CoA reductase [Trinickia caryophylli]WQE14539.1 acetoacetyl-CoA reductase [Trinickia caryophylli]SMF31185.1 3-oxoacyl-[acyl-carrier-protein] reductase [Trinickia caryophylli]GLU32053.1 beta-ketoacyl-ACP reductase [Trinickia caryophylli]
MTRKLALVTGGMGGIGEAISVKLQDAGHTVVVTYSPSNTNADNWLAQMDAQGRPFRAYPADVADYDSCERCAAQIRAEIGPVDILINNAGITRDASFKKLEKGAWDAVLRTNLDSLFNMTKQWYEGMTARGWGRIVNISSVIGCKGGFGQTNYAAAKAGMHGFTKSLALELARKGVTVNTVSPGFIATRMVTAVPEEIMKTKILPEIPVGRLGKPEEVAALVAYLCSDDAGFVTGANISINGGQHLQ